MLTKKDRQQLIKDFKEVFATKDDLKGLVSKDDAKRFSSKEDLKELAKQKDLLAVKTTLVDVKAKLDELYDFSVKAFGNLFVWTDEIHRSIVKDKLPQRVKKLEEHVKLTSQS